MLMLTEDDSYLERFYKCHNCSVLPAPNRAEAEQSCGFGKLRISLRAYLKQFHADDCRRAFVFPFVGILVPVAHRFPKLQSLMIKHLLPKALLVSVAVPDALDRGQLPDASIRLRS